MDFAKVAKVITQLQPHQEKAVAKALLNNIIFAHATGSGKTLTSIAAADRIGKPTIVLTPASLVNNYKKEIAKHLDDGSNFRVVSLPTAEKRNYPIPRGATVILDEAHALRNPNTSRYKYLDKQLSNAGRIIALTGTPAYNQLADLGPIVNIIARNHVFPTRPGEFNKHFLQKSYDPQTWSQFFGFEPYDSRKKTRLKNATELKKKLQQYVDIYGTSVEKPQQIDEEYEVLMDPEQQDVYDYVMKGVPPSIKYLLQNNLPPNKQQAKQLNAFLTGVRQVANTPEAFQDKNKTVGSKIRKAVEILEEEYARNPKLRAFVYSNFKDSGVDSVGRLLTERKIPYAVFHGGLTPKQKARIVAEYNAGKLPVVLGTGSASEGLDLKGTNIIQLLEPHFNDARIQQVIGRGIRYKSHDDLPPEERKVRVQRFFSKQRPGSLHDISFGLLGEGERDSVDRYLYNRAKEKNNVIDQVKGTLYEI